MSHEDSAISKPARSRLFKLIGRKGYSGEVAAATKHIWWPTYEYKSEKRAKGTVVKLAMIKK